ncbi:hypothetical protein BS17DRAFT_705336, partial [Gyrodon lividus]
SYILPFVIIILCQATIAFRVWYLFSRKPLIRTFVVLAFFCCTVASTVFAGILFHKVREETASPDPLRGLISVAIYVPSLGIHTILFGLKLYRFAVSPKNLHGEAFLRRFLKEWRKLLKASTGSLLFTISGLSLATSAGSVLVGHLVKLDRRLPVGTSVVSVCHAMLGIRSLASTFHVDPEWLLNHAEMSRVPWRLGGRNTEIYVEFGIRE